jgi:branched-chain amino acid transport system ATP-binding protein
MLTVKNVSVFYEKIQALDKVSITVNDGELVTVIGANGAGKTTLVKAIMGLIPYAEGKIELDNIDLAKIKPWDRIVQRMAYVPEGSRIFHDLTVKQNILMGAFRRKDREIDSDLDEIYNLFPVLKGRLGQFAGTLSGGEQQMLAIARSLIARPQILLIDEMSLGLMPVLIQELFRMIQKLRARKISVLLIEQNAKKAIEVADRAYLLENGKILMEGESRKFIENNRIKEAYLGG